MESAFPSIFPNDFSVLVTARPQTNDNSFILAMHNAVARLRIGVEVGTNPRFVYADKNNSPGRLNSPTFNGTSIRSGEWTRFAYAVRGRQVTLYINCQPVRSITLDRDPIANLENDGLLIVGRELGGSKAYEVNIISTLIQCSSSLQYCIA